MTIAGFLVCLEWVLNCYSCYVCQMTGISKDPKILNFLKDPARLYAHFLQDTTDPEPPELSPEWGRTRSMPHEVSLPPRGKLTGLSSPLVRRKREMGRHRPLEPLIFVRGPFFSSRICYLVPCPSFHHSDQS